MSYPSVVRVFATTQDFDYDSPWQAQTPSNSTGSGVVISPGRVLTGAHVVANATFLQVQKVSDPNKAIARVEAICHDCDLALLSIDDPSFTKDTEIAEIGALPTLRDRVSVVGYPIGGEEISITEGVVSRIEVQRYSHSQRYLLAVTVDAAINSGNSGGPVLQDGKVVGIAFQKLNNADNIGEMVPANLIQRFLKGVETQRPLTIPGLGFTTQKLENPILRQKIGLQDDQSGILINNIAYDSTTWDVLQPGDALLELNGHRIANNGTIRYKETYRTRYDVVLGDHYVDDEIPITILRDKEPMQRTLQLKALEHLVPRSQYDISPTYFVYGGLVFQILTRDLLTTWKNWWDEAPKEFLHLYYSGIRTPERQEIIVLTQILADEINVGYETLYNESVLAVNGTRPKHMQEFAQLIQEADGLVEIQLSSKSRAILDVNEVKDSQERILKRYHIGHDRSENLR